MDNVISEDPTAFWKLIFEYIEHIAGIKGINDVN